MPGKILIRFRFGLMVVMRSRMLLHGARWPSGLEHWTGDRVVLGSNLAAAVSLRNFDNSVYPALPVAFGGDTKSRRSLLSGVYAGGSKRCHQSALEMCNLLWTPTLCNTQYLIALQYRKESLV